MRRRTNAEQLQELSLLWEQGLLSPEEHTAKRQEIQHLTF
jgi:hypothetical protein